MCINWRHCKQVLISETIENLSLFYISFSQVQSNSKSCVHWTLVLQLTNVFLWRCHYSEASHGCFSLPFDNGAISSWHLFKTGSVESQKLEFLWRVFLNWQEKGEVVLNDTTAMFTEEQPFPRSLRFLKFSILCGKSYSLIKRTQDWLTVNIFSGTNSVLLWFLYVHILKEILSELIMQLNCHCLWENKQTSFLSWKVTSPELGMSCAWWDFS